MAKKILVVDDDLSIFTHLSDELGAKGYDFVHSSSIEAVRHLTDNEQIDAIILDRLLGDEDTIDRIAGWRDAGIDVPILILSSMVGLRERVEGLHAGADAYMTKPFDVEELDAKLKALLRMRERHAAGNDPDHIKVGNLALDRRKREARSEGRLIALHPREFKLLEELALHAGDVVSRTTLLEKVWNLQFDPRTKLIESHVSRLRGKLEYARVSSTIVTSRGNGYCLCDGDKAGCA